MRLELQRPPVSGRGSLLSISALSLWRAAATVSHLYKGIILSILTICKDVLANRDWLIVWQATGHCPLSFNARLVHAYLRRKRKATEAPNFTTIAGGTGINRDRGVPKAVRELLTHGLAVKDGTGYRPVDPGDRHAGWFALRSDGKGPRFFRVYLLSTSKLTDKTNALYWLMVNLDSQRLIEGSRLRRNTKSGLASMLGIARETVHDGLKTLASLSLFSEEDDGLHVHPPTDPSLWKRRQGALKGGRPGQDLWSKEPPVSKIAEPWEDMDSDDEYCSYLWEALAESWRSCDRPGTGSPTPGSSLGMSGRTCGTSTTPCSSSGEPCPNNSFKPTPTMRGRAATTGVRCMS